MLNLPSLALASLSLAAGTALAQDVGTRGPELGNCQGGCDTPATLSVPAPPSDVMTLQAGHASAEAPRAAPGSAPTLLGPSASFVALASDPLHFQFTGFGSPASQPVQDFEELGWNEIDPPAALALQAPATAPASVPPRAIPEPNIYALMLAGLAAGAWASRRRKH